MIIKKATKEERERIEKLLAEDPRIIHPTGGNDTRVFDPRRDPGQASVPDHNRGQALGGAAVSRLERAGEDLRSGAGSELMT